MHVVMTVLGSIFFLTPIAYTFLRALGKIGPKDPAATFLLFVFLWFAGIIGGVSFFEYAMKLWPGLVMH